MHRPTSPVSEVSTAKPSAGLSPQARQAIAIGGLLLCLLVGAGIIYFFLASPSRRTVKVDPAAQTQDFSGRPGVIASAPRRQASAIWQQAPDTWRAQAKMTAMRLKKEAGKPDDVLLYYNRDFLPQDMVSFLSSLFRARNDAAMAKQWDLSADQLAQLKKLPLGPLMMVVDDKERQEMGQLMETYINANGTAKSDAEQKLVARLQELGKAKLNVSRQPYIDRLEAAKKILTPEQVRKMT